MTPDFSETRGFVSVEVRIITAEKETFQPVGFEENLAGSPPSFDLQITGEPVNTPGNIAVYHRDDPCPFDV